MSQFPDTYLPLNSSVTNQLDPYPDSPTNASFIPPLGKFFIVLILPMVTSSVLVYLYKIDELDPAARQVRNNLLLFSTKCI